MTELYLQILLGLLATLMATLLSISAVTNFRAAAAIGGFDKAIEGAKTLFATEMGHINKTLDNISSQLKTLATHETEIKVLQKDCLDLRQDYNDLRARVDLFSETKRRLNR